MKTSSAKAKGRRLAQLVKKALLIAYPHRNASELTVTPSGVTGPDLHFTDSFLAEFGFQVECKNQERVNHWKAWAQAKSHLNQEDLASGIEPLLITGKNNHVPLATLTLEAFLELLSPTSPREDLPGTTDAEAYEYGELLKKKYGEPLQTIFEKIQILSKLHGVEIDLIIREPNKVFDSYS